MPEGTADEHIVRAESMCQRGSRWATATSVELALYFYSNHLDTSANRSSPKQMRTADRQVLQLFDFFDKLGPVLQVLQKTKSATAQALLARFFASAVRLGRVDALRKLNDMGLDVRSWVERWIQGPEERGETMAPIDVALHGGDVGMVDFLLSQGANFTCLTKEEAEAKGIPRYQSMDAALDCYAGPLTRGLSLVDQVLRAHQDHVYPEAVLVGHLRGMLTARKSLKRHPAALPILERLWAVEQSSGLQNPLAVLIYAIRFGRREMVEALVARVPDLNALWPPNIQNNGGDTAMTEAAWAGDRELSETLLRHGASPDPVPAGSRLSALQIAAFLGNNQLAFLLVENGANVNRRSTMDPEIGSCATVVAGTLRGNHLSIVEHLLDPWR